MPIDLKIALVQTALVWENPLANIQHFEALLKEIKQTDIIVLPEMFSTGFSMNTSLAEDKNGSTIQWMKRMAVKKQSVVCGSVMIKEQQNVFNRFFWAQADGEIRTYNKRHLFSLGEEHQHFTAGTEKIIIHYKDWKICPMICYDLRFPVWSRNREEYDLLLYVASWPQVRDYAWKTLLPARAIENKCFVIGVNRIGKDGNNVAHSGDSVAYNALGQALSNIPPNEETVQVISFNHEALQNIRLKFPFLQDKDKFNIEQ